MRRWGSRLLDSPTVGLGHCGTGDHFLVLSLSILKLKEEPTGEFLKEKSK